MQSDMHWQKAWAIIEPQERERALQHWLSTLEQGSSPVARAAQKLLSEHAIDAARLAALIGAAARPDGPDPGPLLRILHDFGAALADGGAHYRELQALGRELRRRLAHTLPQGASVEQSFALQEAVELGFAKIGEAYVSAREQRVRAERLHVEQALRASELRFRRLFEAGIIGILICDVHGNIKDANDGFLQMVGYTRDEVLSGKVRWADMTPPEWRAQDDAAIEQLKVRGATHTWEKEYLRKDGSRVPILVGVAMLDQSDCIAFVLDNSERRRLEALRARSVELEAQNARVRESSRLKSEFLANMSHELRTPLNSIIGFADVLYDREVPADSPKHHELIGDILRSGRHLLQLINDVLDLAKVEAGKLDFRHEPTDLPLLVHEVASILRSVAAEKRIAIETDIDPSLSEISVDPGRLKQVLYNYVSNALKFTDSGGRVTIRAEPEGDALFRVSVQDTGIGIAEHDLPRLFIEFQQLDAGAAKRHAGTGLGLALTKRIVEAQAGSVGVTSLLGQGSTFYAVLPRQGRGASLLNAAENTPAKSDDAFTVLVIEDDARDRRLLSRVLTDAGYGVDHVATGAQAIASCARRAYDAITLDLLLPDISGLEVLHRIRLEGMNRATPVVVVSVVAEKGVLGGYAVHDYITKPINSQVLLDSLERAQVPVCSERSIWVVDDDPDARKLMQTVLSQLGYRVHISPSASGALERLTLDQPSAIVLDLMMPDMDGFEFLSRLRRAPEHDQVPVIVWTMKDLTPDDHKRLHRAAQAVLLKGGNHNHSLTQQMRIVLQRELSMQRSQPA